MAFALLRDILSNFRLLFIDTGYRENRGLKDIRKAFIKNPNSAYKKIVGLIINLDNHLKGTSGSQ
jgi:hypothetical protein